MRLYELDYLISGDVPEKEVSVLANKIQSLLEKEEAEIEESKTSSLKELAYPIKDKKRAFLVTVIFNLEPEKIEEIIKSIKKEDEILRHLVFKKRKIKEIEEEEEETEETEEKEGDDKKTKAELDKIEKKLEEILKE